MTGAFFIGLLTRFPEPAGRPLSNQTSANQGNNNPPHAWVIGCVQVLCIWGIQQMEGD